MVCLFSEPLHGRREDADSSRELDADDNEKRTSSRRPQLFLLFMR